MRSTLMCSNRYQEHATPQKQDDSVKVRECFSHCNRLGMGHAHVCTHVAVCSLVCFTYIFVSFLVGL